MDYTFLKSLKTPFNLREVKWPAGMTVLACAPHPDDFDAVCMTMKAMKDAGVSVRAIVCPTASGFMPEDAQRLSVKEREDIRNKEQRESLKKFGLTEDEYEFAGVEQADNLQVCDTKANRTWFLGRIRAINPDILVMPHGNDSNRAHRDMAQMISAVAGLLDRETALFFNSDAKTVSMRSDCYCPFTEQEAAFKAGLLRCHTSQHERNLKTRGHGFDERVLMMNRKTASGLGLDVPYGESFEIAYVGIR